MYHISAIFFSPIWRLYYYCCIPTRGYSCCEWVMSRRRVGPSSSFPTWTFRHRPFVQRSPIFFFYIITTCTIQGKTGEWYILYQVISSSSSFSFRHLFPFIVLFPYIPSRDDVYNNCCILHRDHQGWVMCRKTKIL